MDKICGIDPEAVSPNRKYALASSGQAQDKTETPWSCHAVILLGIESEVIIVSNVSVDFTRVLHVGDGNTLWRFRRQQQRNEIKMFFTLLVVLIFCLCSFVVLPMMIVFPKTHTRSSSIEDSRRLRRVSVVAVGARSPTCVVELPWSPLPLIIH